jgi:hypothetical protein
VNWKANASHEFAPRGWPRYWWWLLAGILAMALPAAAQLEVGDNWSMSLSGDIGYNYHGNISQGFSGHSMGFAGDANLTGSYYNPNFLNFNVQPYYDRTQSNSVFGALTNTTGVNSNVNLFSGSHFPGSFSYSKGNNSVGEFGIPGSQIGLASHGNYQGLALTWSELLPDMPTLTATYAINDGSSSIFGAPGKSDQSNKVLTLMSTYSVGGFRLSGGYTHRNVHSNFTELLDGFTLPVNTDAVNDSYQFSGMHSFPMQGSYSFSWNRSKYGYDYHNANRSTSSGTSDTLNGVLVFRPARKLSVSLNTSFNNNLLGNIPETVLSTGQVVSNLSLGSFRSWMMGASASYQVISNLDLQAVVNHDRQSFLGRTYEATQFGGSANYNLQHRLLGSLSFSVGAFDTATQEGNSALGFVGNLNFARKMAGWEIDANASYSQNTQTMILLYTTSSIGYVGNVRRRLGNRMFWMAGFGGSHSALAAQPGSSSSSQRWSSTFTYHSYSLNGFYSKSDGAAAFTTTGLVPVPIGLPPSLFAPGSIIEYGSKAWGVNASTVIKRRLTVSGGYADSNGSTVDPFLSTQSSTQLYNAIFQYRLRKIFVNGGYTRLHQSVGVVGTAPVTVMTYYIGISRWFNFF